jgi:Macrocin-O-methyltransferase (TylF)
MANAVNRDPEGLHLETAVEAGSGAQGRRRRTNRGAGREPAIETDLEVCPWVPGLHFRSRRTSPTITNCSPVSDELFGGHTRAARIARDIFPGLSENLESQAAGSRPAEGDGRPPPGLTTEEIRAQELKRRTDRPIVAPGPGPSAETLRTAYLDLLKLVLCDLAGARTLSVTRTGNLRRPETQLYMRELGEEELALRAGGGDWPLSGLSMIGLDRLDDVQECVESVVANGVPGDVIEAGVWRGGASMLARATLDSLGDDRRVWLADSFEGLPPPDLDSFPQDRDLDLSRFDFLSASVDEVMGYFARFGLDHGVRIVEGLFDRSLPPLRGRRWSVVRLDGDTYESTWIALDSLYPGLSAGGFLIADDYLLLRECRAAVDDYRREHAISEPMHEIDWCSIRWRREDEPDSQPPNPEEASRWAQRPSTRRPSRSRLPTARELELERELTELRELVSDEAGKEERKP